MTTPQERPDPPAPAPTVSTVPPESRRRVPSHLGPARTSTVILAVLWLALGALYLNVRPENPERASRGTTVQTTDPARTTTAPPGATTTAPSTTAPTTTESTPTTPTETTPATSTPSSTGTSEPTVSEPTTTPPPTTAVPLPTTTAPTS